MQLKRGIHTGAYWSLYMTWNTWLPRSQEVMIWMLYFDFAKISSKGLWRKYFEDKKKKKKKTTSGAHLAQFQWGTFHQKWTESEFCLEELVSCSTRLRVSVGINRSLLYPWRGNYIGNVCCSLIGGMKGSCKVSITEFQSYVHPGITALRNWKEFWVYLPISFWRKG